MPDIRVLLLESPEQSRWGVLTSIAGAQRAPFISRWYLIRAERREEERKGKKNCAFHDIDADELASSKQKNWRSIFAVDSDDLH